MSRAYRPRLSKDKAVAQRVGAELERERLYGYSVSRLTAALGTPDSESPNSSTTATALPAAAATAPAPAAAEPPPPPPLPPEHTEVAVDAVGLRARPSTASRRRSSTPSASSKGSSRLQRNSNRDTTAINCKASSPAASAAAVAGSPAPSTWRLGLVDSSLGRSPSPREASRPEASRSEASRDGWPCVSCSFLNVETAKKCLMCNTRHCQPRPSPPPPPPVAVAASAEALVDDADDVGARGSAVGVCSSTNNQGRRGSGVRERRSSRGSPSSDDVPSSARRRKESSGFVAGDIGADSDDDCVDDGESTTLAVAIGGRGPSQGSVGRNGANGARAGAGAGTGAEGKGASATGVAPAAAGATLREGKIISQAAAAVATAAAPASAALAAAALAAAAATVTVRVHFSMPDNDDGDACRSFGLPSPSPSPPPPPPPPLPLPPSLPQQTRGRKRSRAPPSIAAAEQTEATEAPSSPASRSAAVALLQSSTKGECLTIDLSGDASSSPAVDRRRRTGSSLDRAPGATTNGNGLEPPMPTTPTRRRAKAQKHHPPPVVVTPLTDDVDERKGRHGPEVAKGTTSVAASVAVAADEDVGSGAGIDAGTNLACVSPSRGASARGRSWPTAARIASLDFSRGGAWKVSSVTVTVGGRRRSDVKKNGSNSAGIAPASAAVIVVCHSGGVSVWRLTGTEVVCRYVSPALTSESKESARGRFFVAGVVGGDVTEVAPSAARTPERMGMCIVAIGRHEADPGLPIIRVWQGSPRREGFEREDTAREKTAPPEILTATVKKKFTSYFPPVVPRNVAPCLCLCGYSMIENPSAGGGAEAGWGGGEGEVEVGEVTAVIALGGKVVRLICAPGRSGSGYVKAKSLPTGGVGSGAVCTSLAPVPSNPFLVWASFPSSNAILLWDVRELQLLLTLPLTSSSICVPAVAWPWPLNAGSRDDNPSIAEGDDAGSASAAGSDLSDPSPSLSSPAQLRRSRGARRDPRLLCMLATGSRSGGGGGGGSGGGSGRNVGAPTRTGCGLFGVCRAGSDGGEGALGRSSSISAIRLEAVARDEKSPPPVCSGDIYSERRRGSEDETREACLSCLCEGNGFMAGVDRQGRVVARDLLTGEPHVLFTAATADNTRGGEGVVVSSMDCDRCTGVFAVSTGDVGGGASNFVDIYTLSKAGGELATGLIGDVRVTA